MLAPMGLLHSFLSAIPSITAMTASPLYRYPYRWADEAWRGDWKRIGQDVATFYDKEDER